MTKPSPDPRLARPADVDRAGLCIGCGACAASAGAAMTFDRFGQLKPRGAAGGDAFARICPFSPAARDEDEIAAARFPAAPGRHDAIGRYEAAYVGHVAEGELRMAGSSGGMASWVALELLRQGLVDGVAHVTALADSGPADPLFRYRISREAADLGAGAKSRYYPVELSGVIDEIRRRPGRYAVVGAPCFVKAVHLLRGQDPILGERIAYIRADPGGVLAPAPAGLLPAHPRLVRARVPPGQRTDHAAVPVALAGRDRDPVRGLRGGLRPGLAPGRCLGRRRSAVRTQKQAARRARAQQTLPAAPDVITLPVP